MTADVWLRNLFDKFDRIASMYIHCSHYAECGLPIIAVKDDSLSTLPFKSFVFLLSATVTVV